MIDALGGKYILLVEDEYFIVNDLVRQFVAQGARIVGPVSNVKDACRLIQASERIDGAVLDLNLQGQMAFPVADALIAKAVPVVFATGYDGTTIPKRYAHIAQCQKPVDASEVVDALRRIGAT